MFDYQFKIEYVCFCPYVQQDRNTRIAYLLIIYWLLLHIVRKLEEIKCKLCENHFYSMTEKTDIQKVIIKANFD